MDDTLRERARQWLLHLIVRERKGQNHRFLHSFYSAGSTEQIVGVYGKSIIEDFNQTVTLAEVADYMAAFTAAERDAAVEECCKDVCSYCRDGDVPERRMYSHPPKPFWVHTMIGFDDRTEDCNAGEIHERLGKSAIRSRVTAKGEK